MIADTFYQETGPNKEVVNEMVESLGGIGIDSNRVYVSGFSLDTFSPYQDYRVSYDPEIVVPSIEDFKVVCDQMPSYFDGYLRGYNDAMEQMNQCGTSAMEELDEWEEELFHDEFCFWGV